MSEKDKKLIAKANSLNCIDWSMIDGFIEQAETEEAKERLRTIRNYKYHLEEYKAGIL